MTVRCPDCGKNNTTSTTDGKVKCRRCLQYIVVKNGNGTRCIPSSLI